MLKNHFNRKSIRKANKRIHVENNNFFLIKKEQKGKENKTTKD